jgi:hypothetical protein
MGGDYHDRAHSGFLEGRKFINETLEFHFGTFMSRQKNYPITNIF